MTRKQDSTCNSLVLVSVISLSLTDCSSGKQEPAAAQDNDAGVAAGNAAQESASTASTITISNATPATANGEFRLGSLGHVPSIGDATMER